MKYQATLPAVRCRPETKEKLQKIALEADLPLGAIQRRAFEFFLSSINTECIDKPTMRIEKEMNS